MAEVSKEQNNRSAGFSCFQTYFLSGNPCRTIILAQNFPLKICTLHQKYQPLPFIEKLLVSVLVPKRYTCPLTKLTDR